MRIRWKLIILSLMQKTVRVRSKAGAGGGEIRVMQMVRCEKCEMYLEAYVF